MARATCFLVGLIGYWGQMGLAVKIVFLINTLMRAASVLVTFTVPHIVSTEAIENSECHQ